MTTPQPGNAPDTTLVPYPVAAWAQPAELAVNDQPLLTYQLWGVVLEYASDLLWAASGQQWRNVQATETVTLDPPDGGCGSWVWAQAMARWGAGWSILTDPARPRSVRLPRPDVTAVTDVTLDGDPFTDYRLAGNWLIRTDTQGWPMATTTRITYNFGRLVPPSGKLAVITLASELGKWFAGKPCQLPARVTSVTRQGISFETLEALPMLKEGLTGIPAVDLWINTVNRRRASARAEVWSPDLIVAREA